MNHFLYLAVPILFGTAWLYTAHVLRTTLPSLRNKAICILIAHPDDEAMFFAPTVLALTDPKLGNHVKILCLSSGNAENLGAIRKREIVSSALLLGLRSSDDVLVLESANFPDSMSATWPATKIAEVLVSAFSKPALKMQRPNDNTRGDPPTATIDVLITFDKKGISSHPNHISLYHGAKAWLRDMMKGKEGWECPVILYTLTSTTIFRKYSSVFDAPLTLLQCVLHSMRTAGTKDGMLPCRLMFLSDIWGYRTAQKAMTEAHKSQMRWFRWGWIVVGRYMVVNDLRRE